MASASAREPGGRLVGLGGDSYESSQQPVVGNSTRFLSWPHLVAAKQMEGLVLKETASFLIPGDST